MSTATPSRSGIDPLDKAPEPEIRRSRLWIAELYRSAVGKKYVMALTGIAGLIFIVIHAVGNLHVYEGALELSEYGEALRAIGGSLVPRTVLLWVGRIGLIAALVLHVHAAYVLTWRNRRMRPVKYGSARHYIAADYASRTMIWTGTLLLAFILFHLADLTWGFANPEFVRGAVTNNLVGSLSRWWTSIFYIVSMLALGLHIYHGTWSLFQSLGLNNKRFNAWRRHLAVGLTVLVVGINLTFPLGTLFGVIDCDEQCEDVTEAFESGEGLEALEAEGAAEGAAAAGATAESAE
ncbi:succinate dehydrogenase cytochrome b subunit [Euzebya sp.]|uniref:succinate dehydrogenase cytochrome b subunit n=1 Tax=Euzebya sp. TaxID=1971409 RepID=UPI003515F092